MAPRYIRSNARLSMCHCLWIVLLFGHVPGHCSGFVGRGDLRRNALHKAFGCNASQEAFGCTALHQTRRLSTQDIDGNGLIHMTSALRQTLASPVTHCEPVMNSSLTHHQEVIANLPLTRREPTVTHKRPRYHVGLHSAFTEREKQADRFMWTKFGLTFCKIIVLRTNK